MIRPRYCDKAEKLDDKCVDAYVNRGDLYYTQKKYKLAEKDYKKTIGLDEKRATAYTGLGNIYSNYGNYGLAEENFQEAKSIDENNAYAHAGLGYLRYKAKDYDNALAHYNEAIVQDNNLASAYNDRGTIYYIKKKYGKALGDLRKAIELDDTLADAHYQCGNINYEKELYTEALVDYKKARDIYEKADASLYVSLLNKKITEITGIQSKPVLKNQKTKLLMDKINESGIKESIKEAKASFKDFIAEKERNTIDVPELIVLRRWNSYTPIIANKELSKGGGYFFKIHNYGIVIDPGFNFLDNFISAGYLFQDIDHILITHAHNDHTADLESILTLLHQYNEAILGDYDTHEEGTVINDVISDISNQGAKVKYEDKDYIEELAKKEFEDSPRRKRIRIYMSASTFEKYSPMLKLYEKTDYDVVLIKADDEIPIMPPNPKQTKYPDDMKITAIKAKHDDLFSDRDSLGYIIHYEKFVLVYTGDTGYSPEIEKQYIKIYKKYKNYGIVLLAHLGGFKEYEKKFAASKSVDYNRKAFYKNHLGRLGLAKVVNVLHPKICIISEFGEEFRNNRIKLTELFHEVYKDETFFIPADIGLRINASLEISLIYDYYVKGIKVDKKTGFYSYCETKTCEIESEAALIYYKDGNVTEVNVQEFMKNNPQIRRY